MKWGGQHPKMGGQHPQIRGQDPKFGAAVSERTPRREIWGWWPQIWAMECASAPKRGGRKGGQHPKMGTYKPRGGSELPTAPQKGHQEGREHPQNGHLLEKGGHGFLLHPKKGPGWGGEAPQKRHLWDKEGSELPPTPQKRGDDRLYTQRPPKKGVVGPPGTSPGGGW